MKRVLVLGAGGFIGSHLVKRLKAEGCYVVGADRKLPEFSPSPADEFIVDDLRNIRTMEEVFSMACPDEVYQLAAEMGGAGYIFTGENDAAVMHNSALINLNAAYCAAHPVLWGAPKPRVFFASSACIYPERNQMDPDNPNCEESSAYPAAPDSEYGWEKLFSERMWMAHARNCGLEVRIGRYHNIFGPEGTWRGGREKAPAAICRKVAEAPYGGTIQVWGDGKQTRSFLYIDECVEATLRLMRSDCPVPVNIGSDEMVSIDKLVTLAEEAAEKPVSIEYVPGPLGVRGRNSDNRFISRELGWAPFAPLYVGIQQTYAWIAEQVEKQRREEALQELTRGENEA